MRLVGWIVKLDGIAEVDDDGDYTGKRVPYRLWSGEGVVRIDGESYQGVSTGQGSLMRISRVEDVIGAPTSRTTVDIAVPPNVIREMLDIDVGPIDVDLRYITSTDNGKNWTVLPVGVHGQLSRPTYSVEGSIYTVEIETWSGDADRGIPKKWSHETQNSEFPNDLGMEFMRPLADSFEGSWPP